MGLPLRENEAVVENQLRADEKESQCFVVQGDRETGSRGIERLLEETSNFLKEPLTDGMDVFTADLCKFLENFLLLGVEPGGGFHVNPYALVPSDTPIQICDPLPFQ